MIAFSESVSFDQVLARFDIEGSLAHAEMLAAVGLISSDEWKAIENGLKEIREEIEAGKMEWDPALEDVHMNIEQALRVRVPAAAKLHTARSRNDQIATDMRLFFRQAADDVAASLRVLLGALLERAEANQTIAIPGYTHLQRAQPVSVAHHLLAWVEMFGRDLERFESYREAINVCPLGAGALAGSTLPVDRERVAVSLGFVDAEGKPRVTRNSLDTVADRDHFIEFCSHCALVGTHLTRVAEDLILWNTSEFGFVDLPDTYTTGSSLMPQKKNPDSLELIRGKSARLFGHVTTLHALVKGLPLTYNRDLQEDKPPVFDAFRTTVDSVLVLAGTVEGMAMQPEKCAAAVSDPLLLATDLADYLVEAGVPFRDAHHQVGALVAKAEALGVPLDQLPQDAAEAIAPALKEDWRKVFNLDRALKARERTGMPGPAEVERQISGWRKRLEG